MWRLVWMIPVWILWLLLIEVPLFLAGLVIVPLGIAFRAYHYTTPIVAREGVRVLEWKWRWMFLWGNGEDGIDGLSEIYTVRPGGEGWEIEGRQMWWWEKTSAWSNAKRIFVWAAWRNSVSNLRFTWAGVKIDQKKVRAYQHRIVTNYVELNHWLAWQGIRGRLHWEFGNRVLEVGWKVRPDDMNGPLANDDARRYGAGFGLRLMLNK